ncbi:sensor histidine kinase [Catellatospora bangladeshensis]|uniref:histidine kinase n=1 Tax=Catellatospora bangladeshensis TaxID=310355 RepID=A0A8J3JN19_9ACTN|nr:HAMP domain-containing sensor histidine kinase [Catellatospora bangladeshensis]GIF83588.1 sensor protein CutS [Catellatospora bangladeshensis]
MNRLTLRVRLTLLYVVLFTVAGLSLLAITYFLVKWQLNTKPIDTRMAVTDLLKTGGDITKLKELLQEKAEQSRQDTLTTIITQGGVALGLVLAAATALAWALSGRALQPLHRITATAGRIAAGTGGRGLHERIALDGPKDEVKQLADTFDAMVGRLDRSFDGQRRFVANASHELRTPLALNRALVELAVTRPDASPDARQLGEALLRVNERHERLIDGLLTLADSENELTERTPVDLADIAEYVLEALPPGGPAVTRLLDAAPVTGDPVLLERLVQNLVENAVRHNVPEDGWLRVETATVGGRARLVVTNSGPVVPAYEMESIFQPFRRLGRERTASPARGLGLGLSIVRAIAQAHHGTATATPRPGGGLTLTVTL